MTAQDTEAALALKLMGYKVLNFGGTMKIETYEIEEAKAEPRLEAEAIELIEKLCLSGQKSLVVDSAGAEARVPYREMNKSERTIFTAIFPKVERVEKYSAGVIPVRALQVISHATGFFDRIEVRYSETAHEVLALGVKGPAYSEKWSALARWGNSLRTLEELREEAREVVKIEFSKSIKYCAEKCKDMIQNLDALVAQHISGETVNLPTAY